MPQTQPDMIRPGYSYFYQYPSVGKEDWHYAFQAAQVRTLELQMLSHAVLVDMANAPDLASAFSLLSGTEYTLPQGAGGVQVETTLRQQREAVRSTFEDLMPDERIVEIFRSRDDFANVRLAVRRVVTDRPIGEDYSTEGNVPPDVVREAFEEQAYTGLPDFVQHAAEEAALAYYQNKDIRQIDYAVDRVQAEYQLRAASQTGGVFLPNLFRIAIDLTNIRTMLRLKFVESDQWELFLPGGFVDLDYLRQGLDLGHDALGQVFFGTPYNQIVETGAAYLASDGSFLKLEQQCDEYTMGFLRQTGQITAGPQPVIAYLLMKEQEIRTVRLILTAQRNNLDTKLILDRFV